MKCYILCDENTKDAIKLGSENVWVAPYEASAELQKAAEIIVAEWSVREREYWRCEADNDGGICDTNEEIYYRRIEPETLVTDGTDWIGVRFGHRFLCFEGKAISHEYNIDHVAGWGDISEGTSYKLVHRKPE